MRLQVLLQSTVFAVTGLAYVLPSDETLVAREDAKRRCFDMMPTQNWDRPETFCVSRWNEGLPISHIAAYKESDGGRWKCRNWGALNRLEISYPDGGNGDIIGGNGDRCVIDQDGGDCNHCWGGEITFSDGETVKSTLFGESPDNPNHAVSFVTINTNKQRVDLAASNHPDGRNVEIDFAPKQHITKGGILIGITGEVKYGVVTHLKFHYTEDNLKDFKLGEIEYDKVALKSAVVNRKYVDKMPFDGTNSPNQTFEYTQSRTQESSYTVEQMNKFSFGFKQSWSAEASLPGIVKLSATAEWSLSTEYSKTRTEGQKYTTTYTVSQKGQIPDGKVVNCYIYTGTYSGRIPFTRKVTLVFGTSDGKDKTQTFTRNGVLVLDNLVGSDQFKIMGCPVLAVVSPDPAGIGAI